MTRFNGPTSVCQKAASGESFARAGSACPNRSSTVATEPGWTVYVRISIIIGFPPLGVTGQCLAASVTFQAWSELALNRVNQVTRSGEPEENIRISEGFGFHHMERAFCHYKLYLSDDRVSCIISLNVA